MIIKNKVKIFYLTRKTKTVTFWCVHHENYKEWFDHHIYKENNKIHKIIYLQSSFLLVPDEMFTLPHYRKVKI